MSEAYKPPQEAVPDYSSREVMDAVFEPVIEDVVAHDEQLPVIAEMPPEEQLPMVPIAANENVIDSNEAFPPLQKETPLENERSFRENAEIFGNKAQELWSSMSEKGKTLAATVYEGIYATPGINRVVAKTEIAFKQFFVDHHEKSAQAIKGKLDTVSGKITGIEKTAADIEASLAKLRDLGAPGTEALQRKSIDLDRQKIDLLLKQEAINSRLDVRVAKMEGFKKERDLIADRLIDTYAEKLGPMERHLDSLEASKQIAEEQAETVKAEHALQLGELDVLERSKVELETTLRGAGMSEGQIKRFETIKLIEKKIQSGRESIRRQEEKMEQELLQLNQNILKQTERANPYRLKQKEFVNLKRATLSAETLGARPLVNPERAVPSDGRNEEVDTAPGDYYETMYDSFPELQEYVEAGAEGDADLIEENAELLTQVFDEDPQLAEFLKDFYIGKFDEEEQQKWLSMFFQDGRRINTELPTLEERPVVLSLPNSNKKLALRLFNGRLTATISE